MEERFLGGHPDGAASINLPSFEDQANPHAHGHVVMYAADSWRRWAGAFWDVALDPQHADIVVVVLRRMNMI